MTRVKNCSFVEPNGASLVLSSTWSAGSLGAEPRARSRMQGLRSSPSPCGRLRPRKNRTGTADGRQEAFEQSRVGSGNGSARSCRAIHTIEDGRKEGQGQTGTMEIYIPGGLGRESQEARRDVTAGACVVVRVCTERWVCLRTAPAMFRALHMYQTVHPHNNPVLRVLLLPLLYRRGP